MRGVGERAQVVNVGLLLERVRLLFYFGGSREEMLQRRAKRRAQHREDRQQHCREVGHTDKPGRIRSSTLGVAQELSAGRTWAKRSTMREQALVRTVESTIVPLAARRKCAGPEGRAVGGGGNPARLLSGRRRNLR